MRTGKPPERGVRGAGLRGDDWTPPAWNSGPNEEPRSGFWRTSPDERESAPEPSPEPEIPYRPNEGGLVLGMALAPAAVGLFSLFVSVVSFIGRSDGAPRGLILVLLMQAGVAFGLALNERNPLVPSWIATIVCSAVLLPLLAIQVSLLREPYVSWSRGSASPAMVATVVVSMVVLAGAVWSVVTGWEHPDEAGLLFMPQAMMVPALIGMHATVQQASALRILGTVMLMSAVATGISWLLQPSARIFVPPAALAVEVLGLWLSGHGPWFHATSGDIVRILYCVMLAQSVVLVVSVPIAAMWVNHGAMLAEEMRVQRSRTLRPPRSTTHGPAVPR